MWEDKQLQTHLQIAIGWGFVVNAHGVVTCLLINTKFHLSAKGITEDDVNCEHDLSNFLEVDDYAYFACALASEARSKGPNCHQATEVIDNNVTRAYTEGNGVLSPLIATRDGLGNAPLKECMQNMTRELINPQGVCVCVCSPVGFQVSAGGDGSYVPTPHITPLRLIYVRRALFITSPVSD